MPFFLKLLFHRLFGKGISGRDLLGEDLEEDFESKKRRLDALAQTLSGAAWLQSTEDLTNADFAIIGAFIQTYCFVDFNGRRAINALRAILDGDESDFSSKLYDADVTVHLRKAAKSWTGTSNVSDGINKAADILDMHRVHRNSFAHWAVRRIKGEDIFTIFTKSARAAEDRNLAVPDVEGVTFGVVSITGLKKELKKLHGYGNFLAEIAGYLIENRVRLRQEHLAREI